MPDVIVIGGGVIGACTAWQLAERGADVLLLERGALASGATSRSQGLLLPPDHAPMVPLFERSNTLYDSLAEAAGIDIGLDREPIGTLMLATDDVRHASLLFGMADLQVSTTRGVQQALHGGQMWYLFRLLCSHLAVTERAEIA